MDLRTYKTPEHAATRERFAALPANAVNWIAVWRRNYLVWRKLALASMFGNLADPMIYLFGLGFGLGLMVGHVDGVSYISFLAAGTVASSVMMSASFESMYSGFSRMHVQRTWEAIMHTPLTLGDIVLAGLAFASTAMIVTALAPSYDFFMFYQTLVLTPMLLLSGVFFPLSQLPHAAQFAAQLLPLAHTVDLIRPALLDRPMNGAALHVAVLATYVVVPFCVSAVLIRRRMMR